MVNKNTNQHCKCVEIIGTLISFYSRYVIQDLGGERNVGLGVNLTLFRECAVRINIIKFL